MRNRTLALLHKLTSYYEEALWGSEGGPGLEYLVGERLFSEGTLRKFRMGIAPSHGVLPDTFTPTERGILKELVHLDQSTGRDRFAGRVIFPITDDQGRPCGFSGRMTTKTDYANKYLNSSTSPLFRKAEFVFGLNHAREAIWKANNVILVEGYTDVLAAHQTGRPIVVGAMGTHFTREQLVRIGRYSMNLHLMFDADSAGSEATQRSVQLAQSMGFKVSLITLPEGVDPDDYFLPKGDPEA